MYQPSWILWKIIGEELQEIVKKQYSSGYRLFSKLHFLEKFFRRLKACEPSFENCVNISEDFFHLVQVTDVRDKKRQQITVRATESIFADSWMLEKEDLEIDIIVFNDLALLMESNVKPMDIFIIWGGKLLYQKNKRCLEINASCSLTPTNIVLFRPRSEKEVSTTVSENTIFLYRMYDYPQFQYDEIKYLSVMELLKIYPKVTYGSENDYEWREIERTDIINEGDVLDSADSENEHNITVQTRKKRKKRKSKTPKLKLKLLKKSKKCVQDDSDSFNDSSSNVNISFDSVNSDEEVLTPEFVNKTCFTDHNYRKRNSKNATTFSEFQEKCAKFK